MKVKANRVLLLDYHRCFKNRVVTVPDSVLEKPHVLEFYNRVVSLGYLEVIEPPVLAGAETTTTETTKKSTKKAT
jgi:hypothetical protein